MQMLIVQNPEGENRVFELYGEDITIGRERGHDMQLAHSSVSREHAQVAWRSGGYAIVDVGSHNGIYVNGDQVVESQQLVSGDVIRLGRYELVYVDGEVPTRFKKLNVATLDRWYTVDLQVDSDSTHHLTSGQMKRLLAARVMLECGVLTNEEGQVWQLEDQVWSMGRGGDPPLSGWFVGGRVAEVLWNGQNHVLKRQSRLRPVIVNGTPIRACTLEVGDCIVIGTNRFTYEVRR
jgi:pSer/pThr/pTyr-binding forkhead associated (FHA) protein